MPLAPVKNRKPKSAKLAKNAKIPNIKNKLSSSIRAKAKSTMQAAGGVLVPGGSGNASNIVAIKIIIPLKTLTGTMRLMKSILGLISFSAFIRIFSEPFKKVTMCSRGNSLDAIFLGSTVSRLRMIKILMNAMMIPKRADKPKVGIGSIKGREKMRHKNAFPRTPKFLMSFSTVSGSFSANSIRFRSS